MNTYIDVNPEWKNKYPRFFEKIETYITPLNQIHTTYIEKALNTRIDDQSKLKIKLELNSPIEHVLSSIQESLSLNNNDTTWLFQLQITEEQFEELAKQWKQQLIEKIKTGARYETYTPATKNLVWLLSMPVAETKKEDFVTC